MPRLINAAFNSGQINFRCQQWLKALCYSILHREAEEDLLAKKNPHEVVPTLENTFLEKRVQEILLSSPPTGRLLHSHLPYSYLPEAVRESGCRIVYLARNPKDTYEELCREPKEQVRKLASFLEKPFSLDGDEEVEKVLWRSSLDRLKELEVPNAHFFRKGTVGDWKNYLTPRMAERIDQLTQFKLQGTGLSLDD
ncbi:unnamed protein product [Linum tenue]|uniref:Sulfotransferase n=1 Tax=Linum tenue TaxID=586396 RepID=A0AAV0H1V7_9ROSI|nr:unnamed protein product [Linum tenue]